MSYPKCIMNTGFGLQRIKQEGRYYTFEPENLNDWRHVVVNLKNKILDKEKVKDISELNDMLRNWDK